jgi:hypothetical protein
MNADREMTADWIHKAENDRKTALALLSLEDTPSDSICYHAQPLKSKATNSALKLTWRNQPHRHPAKPWWLPARGGIPSPPLKWTVCLSPSGLMRISNRNPINKCVIE